MVWIKWFIEKIWFKRIIATSLINMPKRAGLLDLNLVCSSNEDIVWLQKTPVLTHFYYMEKNGYSSKSQLQVQPISIVSVQLMNISRQSVFQTTTTYPQLLNSNAWLSQCSGPSRPYIGFSSIAYCAVFSYCFLQWKTTKGAACVRAVLHWRSLHTTAIQPAAVFLFQH